MFVCALSLTVALLLDPTTVERPTSERQLYQAAAKAISQGDLLQASDLLEELVRHHADGELAEVAAYHWAECLWLQHQPQPALQVLANWSRRIEQPAAGHNTPVNLAADTSALLIRIIDSLQESAASRAVLEELLAHPQAVLSDQFTFAVANELSRRYQLAGDLQKAQAFLSRALSAHQTALGMSASPMTHKLQTRQHFELPLAMAEQELSQGRATPAIDILEQIDTAKLTDEQVVAVRFLLAEALFAAGRHAAASAQFEWLAEQAAELSPKPMWLAAIALRRAELLVRTRDIPAAQQWLVQAKRDHADFARAHEFDYLLARCAVARIEFDEAQECLQRVIDAPTAQATEAVPRAQWMLGEVYFLQRQYPQALAAYATVARMDQFPEWQARALLQSAKCRELLGETAQALAEYQRALHLSQQPELQQSATQRVTALQGSAGERR